MSRARRPDPRWFWVGPLVLGCTADPLYLGPVEGTASNASVGGGAADAGTGPGGTGAMPTSGASGLPADGGTPSPSVCPEPPGPAPVPLPLVVSEFFTPSGGVGDAETAGVVTPATCEERAPEAVGACYRFDYQPLPPSEVGLASWASLLFQYPENNFGADPGLPIAPGATRVSFWARGVEGGERVTFRVGGIRDPKGELPCADGFSRSITVVLSATFESYAIDLSDVEYRRVLGGFGWTITKVLFSDELDDPEPIGFFLDSIRWE